MTGSKHQRCFDYYTVPILTCVTFVMCLCDFQLYSTHTDMWDFWYVLVILSIIQNPYWQVRLLIIQHPYWHVGLYYVLMRLLVLEYPYWDVWHLLCACWTLNYTAPILTCETFDMCLCDSCHMLVWLSIIQNLYWYVGLLLHANGN